MAQATPDPGTVGLSLGDFLKAVREASGMTLRKVEGATGGIIKNAYLSQVENGQIAQPSPATLWQLATVYGLDYGDLLLRAGHRVPAEQVSDRRKSINGIPLKALEELNDDDRQLLVEYMGFLQSRKRKR